MYDTRCSGITDANDLADLILYLADISSTLRAFLEVYPSGGPHLEQVGLIERYAVKKETEE